MSGVGVAGLELAARVVKGAELDGDAGADPDERGEGAFVEGEGAFGAVDFAGCVEGAGVLGGCLEAHFDDVWRVLVSLIWVLGPSDTTGRRSGGPWRFTYRMVGL